MNARHRNAALTWLVVYPLITVLQFALEPLVQGLPMPARTLVLTLIMVPLMAYLAMPAALRLVAGHAGAR